MPYDRFICEDGQEVKIEDCLQECRLAPMFSMGRCMSKRTLMMVAEQRPWEGKPSVTQLLNGTRCNWLSIKYNYPIDPMDMIWALLGTKCHSALEEHTPEDGSISEERLYCEDSSGAFDFYDADLKQLQDVKTYGSYKATKVLGIKKVKEYMFDSQGKPLYFKSGQKRGQRRYKVRYEQDRCSRWDLAVQLNKYRLNIERILKLPVHDVGVEIIVRDGRTSSASGRGLTKPIYFERINKISDTWIDLYFRKKSQDLLHYLEVDQIPPPCNCRERWGGKRVKNPDGTWKEFPGKKCTGYCGPWMYCDLGIAAHKEEKGDEYYG